MASSEKSVDINAVETVQSIPTPTSKSPKERRKDICLTIATIILTIISSACFTAMAVLVYAYDGGVANLPLPTSVNAMNAATPTTTTTASPTATSTTGRSRKTVLKETGAWSRSVSIIYALIFGVVCSGMLGLICLIVAGRRARRAYLDGEEEGSKMKSVFKKRRILGFLMFVVCMGLVPAGIMIGERGVFEIRQREQGISS
ncbi:hypothetical protein TWF694_005376 [Orbilia ellipsospora]|uniref:Transmembrane protein n=1 Tax=Orbilia ellipsospora TaxID=2528407 RepID=A0AAV9WUH8_9PEZI